MGTVWRLGAALVCRTLGSSPRSSARTSLGADPEIHEYTDRELVGDEGQNLLSGQQTGVVELDDDCVPTGRDLLVGGEHAAGVDDLHAAVGQGFEQGLQAAAGAAPDQGLADGADQPALDVADLEVGGGGLSGVDGDADPGG